MSLLTGAITALALGGTPGQPYGDTTKVPPVDARTYSSDFTRLGITGTATRPYGSFTGKSAAASDAKVSATTEVPRVTLGSVSDVDLDTTMLMVPKATLSAFVGRNLGSTMSLIPKATMARAEIASSSINRTSSPSVVPRVTLSVVVQQPIASALSLIPVATLESTVDKTPEPIDAAHSVIPVVTLAATINDTLQYKTVTHSVIPKVTLFDQVVRVNATADRTGQFAIDVRVTLDTGLAISGDVDRIEISSRPFGRIEINAA